MDRQRGEIDMKRRMGFSALTLLVACGVGFLLWTGISQRRPQIALAQAPDDGKLRIIIFGAHPDDAEYRGAGVAMKFRSSPVQAHCA